jgi:hypothetical protein
LKIRRDGDEGRIFFEMKTGMRVNLIDGIV